MSTITDPPASFRGGLARLLEWIDCHPSIPLAGIDYADDSDVELFLNPKGGLDVLTAAADAADALTHAEILFEDPKGETTTGLIIDGELIREGLTSLAIRVEAIVDGEVRALVLSRLGEPADPEVRHWKVCAEDLRALVKAVEAESGAR